MFVTAEEVLRMEGRYGKPAEDRMAFQMGEREWRLLRRSQSSGRAHDVTVYVLAEGMLAAIAKHPYPPGIFRAPSGGVLPGESMEEGIAREMMEEMGLEIRLLRYLLRVFVDFSRSGEVVHWTTHVFTASPRSRELAPQDLREIREARWITLEEAGGRIRETLLSSPSAGLRYRAMLHDRVMAEISRLGDGIPGFPPA